MKESVRLAPGSVCEQCGAEVTAKEIVESDRIPLGALSWIQPADRYGANLPCGHLATAVWSLDETAGMP